MSEVRVRKLDLWVLDWLRAQARTHHRSLEAEVRATLADAARRQADELRAELTAGLAQIERTCGTLPDSASLIREDRESRG